jgi:LuxR family transcriptional regulator, maltose regulon positive regulatory protein
MTRQPRSNLEPFPDLILTKFYTPPIRYHLVSRSNLIARLDEGLTRPLTLISAPAGFGKTTVLSAWTAQADMHVAWLSLDDADNDLIRFWSYIIAALQRIDETIGVSASTMLHAPQPVPIENILGNLINDIALDSEPMALILDDFHLIKDEEIYRSLTFFIEHMAPNMHLIVATRADPPLLSLSQLRARSDLVELRVADLRFTVPETTDFLNQTMDLALSEQEIRMLERRTEGWIAGLQLAAISMRTYRDRSAFINAFAGSNRFILDFLSEQVLQQQSDQVREFLLQTSVLERMNASLCNAVTGINTSQKILEELEKKNLFVIALDDKRKWYRYHHLFADVLQHHLRQTQPGHIPNLHHKASVWYESRGFVDEAIKHALSAGEAERAAQLIEGAAHQMLMRGEFLTLQHWVSALPKGLVQSRPGLAIADAWVLLLNHPEVAEARLQQAERLLSAGEADMRSRGWWGELAAVRALQATLQGDGPRIIEQANLALQNLDEDDLFLRSVVAWQLGQGHRFAGQASMAEKAFQEASRVAQLAGNPFFAMLAASHCADRQAEQGRLRQAAESHRQLHREGRQTPLPIIVEGDSYLHLGDILREWNDLDSAEGYILHGIELNRQGAVQENVIRGLTFLMRLQYAQGKMESASEVIGDAVRVAQVYQVRQHLAGALAWQAYFWLIQNDLSRAVRWSEERKLNVDDELSYAREDEYAVYARILIAQGQTQKASLLLGRILQNAEEGGRYGRVIECLALQALAFKFSNDTNEAQERLERALSLAESENYIRAFVDEGKPMQALISDLRLRITKGNIHLVHETVLPYIGRLLAAFGNQQEPISKNQISNLPTEILVEPLSDRELEVLKLVAEGLSNREIADKLFIEIGTVKTHINNFYGKLSVHNRTGAVARARNLHLL